MSNNRDAEYRNIIVRAWHALERVREEVLAERKEQAYKQLLQEQARAREIFRLGQLSRKTRSMHPTYMRLLRIERQML